MEGFIYSFCFNTLWLCLRMPKISLFVRTRKQGSRIESIPLKRLVRLSRFRRKRWRFEDGWLILEAWG